MAIYMAIRRFLLFSGESQVAVAKTNHAMKNSEDLPDTAGSRPALCRNHHSTASCMRGGLATTLAGNLRVHLQRLDVWKRGNGKIYLKSRNDVLHAYCML